MAHKDLIFQNENMVVLEGERPIPTLRITDEIGIDLSTQTYRRVYTNNGLSSVCYGDSFDDMFYLPSTNEVLLAEYDAFKFFFIACGGSCHAVYMNDEGTKLYYREGLQGTPILVDSIATEYLKQSTREGKLWYVIGYIEGKTKLDLAYLVKYANLDCKVYPFLRLDSINHQCRDAGMPEMFNAECMPIIYVVGTPGYEEHYDEHLMCEAETVIVKESLRKLEDLYESEVEHGLATDILSKLSEVENMHEQEAYDVEEPRYEEPAEDCTAEVTAEAYEYTGEEEPEFIGDVVEDCTEEYELTGENDGGVEYEYVGDAMLEETEYDGEYDSDDEEYEYTGEDEDDGEDDGVPEDEVTE